MYLLQADNGNLLFFLQISALLGQLVVHFAAAHDYPLVPLLHWGIGRPVKTEHKLAAVVESITMSRHRDPVDSDRYACGA